MPALLNERDLDFLLYEFLDTEALLRRERYAELSREVFDATLATARRIAEARFAPHLARGDAHEPTFDGNTVSSIAETQAAWDAFAEAGFLNAHWNAYEGGLPLPLVVHSAAVTWFNAANVATTAYSWLTVGAANLLRTFGTAELKARFLAPMGDGRCAGTMALTEPAQGSALGDITTTAESQADGTYRLRGQKMFISGGDQNLTANIVHMVLGRIRGAPAGVRGISLFLVPKVLVNGDGSLGARNDVKCVSIEHKLGIHASPTCVMAYGDKEGAVGYLVGEENRGLEYMFIMMNLARFSVGMEGVGIAERAYQRAVGYARERVQGKAVGLDKAAKAGAIIEHPDVRRMLMTMRAHTEGLRAVAYVTAAAMDNARRHRDAQARKMHQAFVDLMIPIVKGHSTETGQEVASLGVQVHGGMGYVEETGAAQYLRDARITTIYEGTTGIQANDLVGRKTARDGGAAARAVIAEIEKTAAQLTGNPDGQLHPIGASLAEAAVALETAVDWVAKSSATHARAVHAGAAHYLKLWGIVASAWQLGRAALVASRKLAAEEGDAGFMRAKIATARFYGATVLPQAAGLARTIIHGGEATLELAAEQF